MAAYTTIDNPELYFQCKIYTGTGSSNAITLDGDQNMQPDLVWNKIRSTTGSHRITDSVRGVTKELYPDLTDAEDTQAQGVTAFGTDGFTVGTNAGYNTDSATYVAWCWKESATAGFDIVAYTGDGSARNISHSLSALPHRIIIKARDRSGPDWITFGDKIHTTPHDALIKLNNSAALNTGLDSSWFNDTNPTSSVFSIGTQGDLNSSEGSTYMAYLFTSIQGFSKFGSYTGNGHATNGPYVYTGFQPAWIMVRRAVGGTGNWMVVDNKRPGYNHKDYYKYDFKINNTDAERTSVTSADFFSNGFKVRTDSTDWNVSGDTYIYMAFARAPFVNSNGVPCNAK